MFLLFHDYHHLFGIHLPLETGLYIEFVGLFQFIHLSPVKLALT